MGEQTATRWTERDCERGRPPPTRGQDAARGPECTPGPSSKSRGFPGLLSGRWGLGADLPAGRTGPRRPKASFLMGL